MRLPERGRLFVGGLSPSTGDAELRSHFRRFGEVSDICLPKDSITGRPRCFAFVQFIRPSDAARALADPYHVIDGREVYIDKAEPRRSITPLCQRVLRWRNKCYRVGDLMRIAIGPLSDACEENEYVNQAKKFAAIVDKTLVFYCVIGYISQDGKECLVRWPPVQRDDKPTQGSIPVYDCRMIDKSALPCQGSIVPAYDFRLKDLAQLSNCSSDGDARPHSWCWLMI